MASFLPTYTADGSATKTGINIKTFKKEDIKVYVDDDLKTAGTGTTAGSSHDYEIQSYTTSSFNIGWVSGKAPTSPSKVRIVRDTVILKADNSDVEGKAVFTAGSSVKAGDLNANQNQALRALEELDDQRIQKYDIDADAVTTTEIRDNTIVNANISTTAAIAGTKVAPDFGSQNIVTTGTASTGNLGVTGNITVSGTVDGRDVATDGSKLDGIEGGATADQTSSDIKTLLASDNLTDAHLAANSVGTSEIKDDAVTNDQLDNSIVSAIAANTSKTTNQTHTGDVTGSVALTIANNAVTTDKIADNDVNDDKLSHTGVTPGSYGTTTSIPTIVVNAQGRVTSASGNTIDTNLVADTSPQLGGNLDVQTREITTSGTNQDITLTPTGSGTVTVKGTGTQSGTLELNTENNALSIKIQAPTNTNLDASDDSYTLVLPVNNGDAGQFLKTDGLGVLSWDTVSGGGGGGGTAAPNSIVTLSESVDGNRTDFSMSVTPASAQNLIVSVNGVVQKPNAGTTIAGSAEGYCVDGATLKFATAPANGSSVFIIEHAATTASDRIVEGNSNVDIFDDNATSRAVVNLDGAEKFRINEGGQIGLGGANYGTDGQVLTSQGSGAAAQWESIPSSDLVNDTSPQLGGNLDVQASEITTSTTNGNIKLTPNGTGVIEVKGASGNDGTLQLNCSQNSHGVKIKSPAHSAGASYTLTLPTTDGNADQVLKTDGSGVLAWVDQTTDTTDLVSDTSPQLGGNLDVNTKNIVFGDSGSSSDDRLQFGASQDLNIFHDGTDSHIRNNEGKLIITQDDSGGDDLHLRAKVNEESIICHRDGQVELYYDNVKKFETDSGGVTVTDSNASVHVKLNTSAGTAGYLSGVNADTLQLVDSAGDVFVKGVKDGAVELYYDNSKKLETTSTGASVTGSLGIGTTSPSYQLSVVTSSGKSSIQIKADGTGANDDAFLRMQTEGTGKDCWIDFGDTADADVGHIRYNHGNNFMSFATDAAERMRINSAGQILSGMTSANVGDANAIFAGGGNAGSNNYGKIYLSANETNPAPNTALSFIGTSTNNVSNNAMAFIGVHSDGQHASNDYPSRFGFFTTNAGSSGATEKVRIHSGGTVNIPSGLTLGQSVTSTAAGNTLDDYEEGSWTPTLTSGGSSVSYLQQYGRYVKIGKMVTLSCRLQFTATGNNSQLQVGGIPFTVISGNGENYTSGGITYCDISVNYNEFDPYLNSTNTSVSFYRKGYGTAISMSGTGQQTNKYLGFSVVYFA